MNAIVIYESKYGSTKQYAEWIARELNAPQRHIDTVVLAELARFDTIIFGSYLHMGKIVHVEFLLDHWKELSEKRVVLFTVSGAGPGVAEQKFFEENVPAEIRQLIHHFAFRGRAMNLDWKDRMLVAFPKSIAYLAYLRNRTPANRAAYEAFQPFDAVKKENIQPLLDAFKGIQA